MEGMGRGRFHPFLVMLGQRNTWGPKKVLRQGNVGAGSRKLGRCAPRGKDEGRSVG